MNTMSKRIALAFVLLLSIAACALSQGLYWETKTTGSGLGGKDILAKSYYVHNMFKHTGEGKDGSTIIRLDKKMFVIIRDEEKTYSEITFDELKATLAKAGSKMSEMMKQMQEKMKDMPEEQRKMMEKMMAEKMPTAQAEAKVDVTPTGEKKSVGGYSCSGYVMKSGTREIMKLWTTEGVNGYQPMSSDLRELGSLLASLNPTHGNTLAEGMKKIKGFPIETDMMGTITTVTKVENRAIPASEFDVPAGYTKVKNDMMKGLE